VAIKAVVTQEEFDDLDETSQALYRKATSGDSFVLDVSGVDEHPSVVGLKNTLAKYREIAPDAKAMAKIKADFDALTDAWKDLSPEEVRAELSRLEELDAGKPDVAAQIEAAKEAMRTRHEKDLKKKDDEITDLREALGGKSRLLEDRTTEREIDEGLSTLKVLPEYREAAKALIYRKYGPKAEEVTDEASGATDYATKLRTKVGEVSGKEFFEWWSAEEEAEAFLPSSGNRGTGSATEEGGRRGGRKNPWTEKDWNMTEQSRIFNENRALARSMASAAGRPLPPES